MFNLLPAHSAEARVEFVGRRGFGMSDQEEAIHGNTVPVPGGGAP